jgi:predicted nucleotidyltransferase component of viral defense system
MQLKAIIKNMAAEKHISAQLVMQNYMLERLLERISLSPYKRNIIIKGGMLISAIVGLDTRATMDLDTTIKGLELTHESLQEVFAKICKVPTDDDISFEVIKTTDIREIDDYPGIRVHLKANYAPISVPLKVDVTTGDKLTPQEIEYEFPLLFDNRSISLLTYNLETIFAEKLETAISRGAANTRPRDYYDIYLLWKLRVSECNLDTLALALKRTAEKRGSYDVLSNYKAILDDVLTSQNMLGHWRSYQQEYEYASGIAFADVVETTKEIMEQITPLLNQIAEENDAANFNLFMGSKT